MQDNNLIIGSTVLKLPIKIKSSEDFENSERLTTFTKSPKRLNESIYTITIFCLILNSISSLTIFLTSSKIPSLLVFSLFPCLLTIILQIFFKFYLKKKEISSIKNLIIQLFLYGLSSLVLIFSDINILSSFLLIKEFALIPNIFYLLVLSNKSISIYPKHKRLVILLNTIFAILSFSLNMIGNQRIESTIIQFIFFLSQIPYRSLKKPDFKIQDIYKLEKENEDSTPIEIVIKMLTSVLDECEEIINCHTCETHARKSFSVISASLETLRSTPNIYLTNLESITRGMNEQDKKFIEQSFSDKSIYSSMNDSDDIRENMNMVYGTTDLAGVLKKIGSEWNFNTFFVNDCSGNKPLQVCGEYIFRKYNFDKIYKIQEDVFLSFLIKLEESYLPNPYHNSCHAADMMCSFLYFFQSSSLIKKMSSIELLSCVLACLAHDVGHKGRSNRFLVQSKDVIALRYNDLSVQEMMHSSILFEILSGPDSNILAFLHNDNWFFVRKIIIEMILSTDMQKHFEILGVAKAKYTNTLGTCDFNDGDVKLDIFKLGIKCADLGHAAKDVEIHSKWCGFLIQEFFDQGDKEKELGMPVSMYCDREDTDISKSQAGFLQNIVLPIYLALGSILRSAEIDANCISQIKRNKSFWSDRRSTSKNLTYMLQKPEDIKKDYLELMEKTGGLKRSITPFIVISNN